MWPSPFLLALYQRNKTGRGMRIDLTMQETGVSAIGPAVLEAQGGITRDRLGCGHWWKAPHNVYPARGDDRWIVIVVSSDGEWDALREAMADADWARDEKFATALSRWENRHELDRRIAEWTSEHDDIELAKSLQERGVSAGACLTAQDLASDPHLQDRDYLWEFANPQAPSAGPRVFAGRPFRDPNLPVGLHRAAQLGEDNSYVLGEIAGLSQSEIDQLHDDGIIFSQPKEGERAP